MKKHSERWLNSSRRLLPHPIQAHTKVDELIDNAFQAYNAARIREICQLLVTKMMNEDCIVGMTLAGALTPAGLGVSSIIPLIEHGVVDWIVSTGANLYHDAHFGLDMKLYRGWVNSDDLELRKNHVIRIYDVLFDDSVLFDTDAFFRKVIALPEFQRRMGTAEFHHLLGKYLNEREIQLNIEKRSILAAAYRNGIPVFTSSPGDSSIGMNVAGLALLGNSLQIDSSIDVNDSAAIVYHAKTKVGRSSVLILGGGSPKNFALQTEPQLQEVLRFDISGHDYFIQITDARPDTGGLSGATPSEAVTWGKVDPNQLNDTVISYCDTTLALPLITAYVLTKHPARASRRLYEHRQELLEPLITQANTKLR